MERMKIKIYRDDFFLTICPKGLLKICFPFIDGAKYHKKELVYLPCNDEEWLVDELRARRRPTENGNLQLSEVLRRSEAFERGDGLLPVRMMFYSLMQILGRYEFTLKVLRNTYDCSVDMYLVFMIQIKEISLAYQHHLYSTVSFQQSYFEFTVEFRK